MLHGLSGFAHDWDDVAPALEQRYRLIALDQRGFGESDRAPDAAYALSDFAGDLEGFVAGMGLGPLTLLGHSLGGRIGILFAAHHPESVERLILVDAAPTMNPAGGKRVLERIAASPDSYETMEAALSAFQPLFPGYSPERLRRRLEQYLVLHPDGGLAIKRDPAFRERSRRHLAGHAGPAEDLWPLLSKLACPILALRGTRSDMVTPDLAQRMVAENGRIRLVEVDNAGHNIPAEQPAVLARAIEEFLDSAG
jgi:pimeloyl-ACP methyl ester carboxylesterase